MQRIAIINQKGGVGKTTTAVNLSAALVEKGKKVLLIDLDAQACASNWLLGERAPKGKGVFQILVNKETILSQMVETKFGVSIVPSNTEMAGLEIANSVHNVGAKRLDKALSEIETVFDYAILDCPPSLGLASYNALVASRKVIVPIDCCPESYEATGRLRETLDHIKEEYDRVFEIFALPTFLEKTRLAASVVEAVEKDFSCTLPSIRKNTALPESFASRSPIYNYDKKAIGAMDYQKLAKEILQWQKNY